MPCRYPCRYRDLNVTMAVTDRRGAGGALRRLFALWCRSREGIVGPALIVTAKNDLLGEPQAECHTWPGLAQLYGIRFDPKIRGPRAASLDPQLRLNPRIPLVPRFSDAGRRWNPHGRPEHLDGHAPPDGMPEWPLEGEPPVPHASRLNAAFLHRPHEARRYPPIGGHVAAHLHGHGRSPTCAIPSPSAGPLPELRCRFHPGAGRDRGPLAP